MQLSCKIEKRVFLHRKQNKTVSVQNNRHGALNKIEKIVEELRLFPVQVVTTPQSRKRSIS